MIILIVEIGSRSFMMSFGVSLIVKLPPKTHGYVNIHRFRGKITVQKKRGSLARFPYPPAAGSG